MSTMLKRKWIVVCYWKSAEIENLTIQKFEKLKLSIACANEWQRQCFLIIINFIKDYEKQIMMINVKNNQYCLIYTMFLKQKENLQKFHEIHTHKSTRKQFKNQVENNIKFIDFDYLHNVENFA